MVLIVNIDKSYAFLARKFCDTRRRSFRFASKCFWCPDHRLHNFCTPLKWKKYHHNKETSSAIGDRQLAQYFYNICPAGDRDKIGLHIVLSILLLAWFYIFFIST